VGAAFLYVRTGDVVRPENLPDRAALERLLLEEPGSEAPAWPEEARGSFGEEPPDEYAGAGR
jgi:DNA helicase-2/ATP-dependent DNA helicase PcrA